MDAYVYIREVNQNYYGSKEKGSKATSKAQGSTKAQGRKATSKAQGSKEAPLVR